MAVCRFCGEKIAIHPRTLRWTHVQTHSLYCSSGGVPRPTAEPKDGDGAGAATTKRPARREDR